MMRSNILRLAALAAGVAIVASCDARVPTQPRTSGGSSSGGSSGNKNTKPPTIVIDSPLVGALVNVGDSIFVSVKLHDDIGLKNVSITGVTQKGSVDLGTFSESPKYTTVTAPVTGTFRPGLKDTTIRRYLQPLVQNDTALDSVIVRVIAVDSLLLSDTAQVRVNLVAGPKVNITAPVAGDSIPAGVGLNVAARAQHPDGINRIDIRVRGEASWPTKLDTTITQIYTNAPRDVVFSAVARIPVNAPIRSKITVTATAVDVNRQPGASPPVAAFIRSTAAAVPRVTQVVPAKTEFADSVTVSATGDGITMVGLIIRDSVGTIVQEDTVKFSAPFNANVSASVALNLPPTLQGKKLGITAFAVDASGRIGFAVSQSNQGSQNNVGAALIDSTLVVYGRTYRLPHQGTVGDIAVDAARGHVFMSNTQFNLLEVWQQSGATKGFSSQGVAVGSLPWGLFVSNNPDTLLVANSGGTNISRVFIGTTAADQIHEDLANRILTRNTYVFQVTVLRDENTGKVRLTGAGPFSYSDRPQYLVQSKGGRIFYSTRPTVQAPAGTIRWLDPSLPVPDPRQIWQYATYLTGTQQIYALFNVDSIAIAATLPTSPESDTLYIFDHPYGQKSGVITVKDPIPVNAVASVIGGGSDAEIVLRLDVAALGLTDTTFAAASGDRQWVAFGEGHTARVGRTIMVADSVGPVPNFFSPIVTIEDLTDNASEKVFGLALDKSGTTVASHGSQSYFSFVSDPFHLRLQGKYDSADDGAGIAFHPRANGTLTTQADRIAFVASASGAIEVVDVAYYINRARLQLKNPIYGPLRASLPMPGDPPEVVLKLYAVSEQGLVVIDLTAKDIKAGP
jgi:hypothetical protein